MAKTPKKSRKKSFVKDYRKILKTVPIAPLPSTDLQWAAQGDYFRKFTMYKDSPSITSPDTLVILNS